MHRIRVVDDGRALGFLEGEDPEPFQAASVALAQDRLPMGWSWVLSSKSARVASGKDASGRLVYWKAFLDRNWLERPKAWLRGSRAKRAWQQSRLLVAHGLNTPEVLCWGRVCDTDMMITVGVQGIGSGTLMREYVGRLEPDVVREKRLLLHSLGREVGRLHSVGIVHGDLRPNNVLANFQGNVVEFNFIDNERNRRYRTIPLAKIQKNLVQITLVPLAELSFTDRTRIFGEYFRVYRRFDRSEIKSLINSVYQRVEERLR